MTKRSTLTPAERAEIAAAYMDAKERDNGESWRNGSHYILMHVLQGFGYSVRTSEQAERLAERLMYGEE